MSNPYPSGVIHLSGYGHTRGVTLALPIECVRGFLPAGLELGYQDLTPCGTHPVVLLFHDMFRAHLSVPSLLPNMTYHEHSVGVPYTFISGSALAPGNPGPYFFMPKLYLDNVLATIGGLLFWGFAKEMAKVEVTAGRYAVDNLGGQQVTSVSWDVTRQTGHCHHSEFPNFEPIRRILCQPIVSMVPAAVGPFFILSDFSKQWEVARLRPLRSAVGVALSYVPGYQCGRYPASGWSPGIDESVLGSYELLVPWQLSLPYPPLLAGRD